MRQLLILGLLLVPSVVSAQETVDLREGVTQAILDMTTTERRHLLWQPCGESFRGHHPEAYTYARNIADAVVDAAGDDLDPWWMVAQLMQESGMNPCVFSSREFAVYRRALGRRPNEQDILRLLRRPDLRQEYGIRALDGGLAQFRWPGTVARRNGIEDPAQLLDVHVSVNAFASALRSYRTTCESRREYRGVHTWTMDDGRARVRHWRYQCGDVYWAIHNTGDRNRIRYQYIRNVQRRYERGPSRWRERVTRPEPTPEGPES